MAVDARALELKLIVRADGVDLDLMPLQGLWTEEQYLVLTNQTNHLIEFTDGDIEVLPMPTDEHQSISQLLLFAFAAVIAPRGVILYSPLRLRIRPRKFREPDLIARLTFAPALRPYSAELPVATRNS